MKIYEVIVIDTNARVIKDYPELMDCETEAQLIWTLADGVPFTFLTAKDGEQ